MIINETTTEQTLSLIKGAQMGFMYKIPYIFNNVVFYDPYFPLFFPIPQPALSISTLTVSQSFQRTKETDC